MRIFRNQDALPADFGPAAITIGNFDGVHLGHRDVLLRLCDLSRERGWKASVLTFDPHPACVVAPERAPRLMTTVNRRAELMEAAGIEQILILPFTAEVSRLTPEEFVQQLLVQRMGARAVLVGDNFRFGCRQAGNVETLRELGARFGFDALVAPTVTCRGRLVSSSAIRTLIQTGKVSMAARLLGRAYELDGTVVTGRGVGSKQTVPTLNLATSAEVIPARGVYVTRTLDLETGAGWQSITNIGCRPTFGQSDELSIETYLLSGAPAATEARGALRVSFLARVREERKFENPEALKRQIMRDVRATQNYFRRIGHRDRVCLTPTS